MLAALGENWSSLPGTTLGDSELLVTPAPGDLTIRLLDSGHPHTCAHTHMLTNIHMSIHTHKHMLTHAHKCAHTYTHIYRIFFFFFF